MPSSHAELSPGLPEPRAPAEPRDPTTRGSDGTPRPGRSEGRRRASQARGGPRGAHCRAGDGHQGLEASMSARASTTIANRSAAYRPPPGAHVGSGRSINQWEALQTELNHWSRLRPTETRHFAPNLLKSSRSRRHCPAAPGHTVSSPAHRPQEKFRRGPRPQREGSVDEKHRDARKPNMENNLAPSGSRNYDIASRGLCNSAGSRCPIPLCLREKRRARPPYARAAARTEKPQARPAGVRSVAPDDFSARHRPGPRRSRPRGFRRRRHDHGRRRYGVSG